MRAHNHVFSVKRMAHVLNVSRSGYYQWYKTDAVLSMHQQRKKEIDQRVKAAFDASKGRSGAERIFVDLEEGGRRLRPHAN